MEVERMPDQSVSINPMNLVAAGVVRVVQTLLPVMLLNEEVHSFDAKFEIIY